MREVIMDDKKTKINYVEKQVKMIQSSMNFVIYYKRKIASNDKKNI